MTSAHAVTSGKRTHAPEARACSTSAFQVPEIDVYETDTAPLDSLKRKYSSALVDPVDEADQEEEDRAPLTAHTHDRQHTEREQRKSPKADKVTQSNVCHRFAQTGRCRFGAECRFVHDTGGFDPSKYTKYDISLDDETLGPGANKSAAMEAIQLARAARAAKEGVKDEPKHVIGQRIIFTKNKVPAQKDLGNTEGGSNAPKPAAVAKRTPKPTSTCMANQLFGEEEEED